MISRLAEMPGRNAELSGAACTWFTKPSPTAPRFQMSKNVPTEATAQAATKTPPMAVRISIVGMRAQLFSPLPQRRHNHSACDAPERTEPRFAGFGCAVKPSVRRRGTDVPGFMKVLVCSGLGGLLKAPGLGLVAAVADVADGVFRGDSWHRPGAGSGPGYARRPRSRVADDLSKKGH